MPSKSLSSEFISLKDLVVIAIFTKVFSHRVATMSPVFTLHKYWTFVCTG